MQSEDNRLETLRAWAASQGVHPTDEDLEAAETFLEVILPLVPEFEERIPATINPVSEVVSEVVSETVSEMVSETVSEEVSETVSEVVSEEVSETVSETSGIARLAERIRARELTPREAVTDYLERIEAHAHLNAYITVRAEEALAGADTPPPGPLHGVPVAVKDVIDVAGTKTTAASKILADNLARRDATVVARLRAAGAVILGKLNTHEFAYGATTTSAHFGPARNPHDPERIAGGSSGGSGVAAAPRPPPRAGGPRTPR